MTKKNAITSQLIRRIIIEQSRRAHVGHIGSALSVADIMATLYGHVLKIKNPQDPSRDRFVLSKGHAALALYAALHLKGWLSLAELNRYCGDDTFLGVHPEHMVPGIEFTTGSLGQGLAMGAGVALAAGLKKSRFRVFVLLSDAECNEGSTWETVMFARQHGLANLIAIVDANGQQAFGYTKDVLNLEPMAERWRAFGWDAREVNGHDVNAMKKVIAGLRTDKGKPHVLIARTKFGKGVSYMEGKIKWHYWPMSEAEYKIAIEEINRKP
jgi:transketolase